MSSLILLSLFFCFVKEHRVECEAYSAPVTPFFPSFANPFTCSSNDAGPPLFCVSRRTSSGHVSAFQETS